MLNSVLPQLVLSDVWITEEINELFKNHNYLFSPNITFIIILCKKKQYATPAWYKKEFDKLLNGYKSVKYCHNKQQSGSILTSNSECCCIIIILMLVSYAVYYWPNVDNEVIGKPKFAQWLVHCEGKTVSILLIATCVYHS